MRPPCDPSDNQEQGHKGDDGGRTLECAPIRVARLPRPCIGAGTSAGLPRRTARLLHPPRRCTSRAGRRAAQRPRARRIPAAPDPPPRPVALVELAGALLSPPGPAAPLPHLSLEPAHRRGWGSTYAALADGRI